MFVVDLVKWYFFDEVDIQVVGDGEVYQCWYFIGVVFFYYYCVQFDLVEIGGLGGVDVGQYFVQFVVVGDCLEVQWIEGIEVDVEM